ncbi:MAG: glycosyltransferase family 2 protein [bacterium]|nr:glycosyltransferase family 2 protein [bacterium]
MKIPLFLRTLVKRLGERFARRRPAARPAGFDCDPEWYLWAYPEVEEELAAGDAEDAGDHYHRLGAARGYDPNVRFRESWYLDEYPDVVEAVRSGDFSCGFEHYVRCGRREGRRSTDLWIDEAWYCRQYPDAVVAIDEGRFRSATEHYLQVGVREGRDPHPVFTEAWYRYRYPDVDALIAQGRFLSGWQHYMTRGPAEARQPHPHFDERHYRALNPDVDAEIRAGRLASGYLHLLTDGLRERRPWRFDELRQDASRLARCRLEEFLAAEDVLDLEPPELPQVSVLLVLFNRAELTLQCLRTLSQARDVTLEVVIVDNHSTDRTREMLDRLRGVRILLNEENRGFTRAANQAAGEARGKYLLFLNNDTELLPTSIRSAVARLADTPGAGAVGGRVIGLDGRLEEAGSIVWRTGASAGYGRGDDPTSGAYLFPREVDYCSGVFLLTRRRTFAELGGFDQRFAPAYYEETDYCFRLRRRGPRTIYDPGSVVVHYGRASLTDESEVTALLADQREVFRELHRDELASAPEIAPAHVFPASNRQRYPGRVMILDDEVSAEIARLLCELGYFVTCFATNPRQRRAARRELPEWDLELITHLPLEAFPEFWENRSASYDLLILRGPHHFAGLLAAGLDPRRAPARVIDAAAATAQALKSALSAALGKGRTRP